MLKIFLKFGKISGSFLIFVCPLGEKFPHEPRIHDQGLLVPGLSENTNTVYSIISTPKVFTKYLIDVTQFWIVHRLSPAWLVSLHDLSAGIAVPGLSRRDSLSVELAVHVS